MSQARELYEYLKAHPGTDKNDIELWKRFNVGLVLYSKSPFGHYVITFQCDDDSSIEKGVLYE